MDLSGQFVAFAQLGASWVLWLLVALSVLSIGIMIDRALWLRGRDTDIERLAREGDPERYDFPRGMLRSGDYQFSFSGLKTAVRYLLERESVSLPDVCASFQAAVLEVLVEKSMNAAVASGRTLVAMSGGVSSNGKLQELATARAESLGLELRIAPRELRTDNAAMIAYVAALSFRCGATAGALDADVAPSIDLERFGRLAD